MMTMPSQQRGLSLVGWCVLLLVAVVLGTAALRMIPAYLEYSTISGAINSLLQDSKTAMMSPREVRGALSKRFEINQVKAIKVEDLAISRDSGVMVVSVDYEVREPLFYNVSIVMAFQEDFSKDIRQ